MSQAHLSKLLAAGAVALLVVALFEATLRWLVLSWLGNPYYSHGPLIVLVSGWLLWRRRDALRGARAENIGLALAAMGVGVHLLALPLQMQVVSAAALVVVLVGLVWAFAGRSVVRAWAFPLAFLLLMIPLPGIERLSPTLEAFTAQYAAQAARWLGVAASNLGGQVSVGAQAFTVGAPCSGLRSLVALGTLALLLAYSVQGPAWARALLVVAALPIALAANLVRVSSIFWVAGALGADAALGFFHTLSSPLLFLVALALLLALGRALRLTQLRADAW